MKPIIGITELRSSPRKKDKYIKKVAMETYKKYGSEWLDSFLWA